PWPGKHPRVVAGDVVGEAIAGEGEAFLDAQIDAVEIAVRVVPAVLVDVASVDDERVAVPVTARVAVPQLHAIVQRWTCVGIDRPYHAVVRVLEEVEARRLDDLRSLIEAFVRKSHRQTARVRVEMPQLRGIEEVLAVFPALLARPGQVWDPAVGRAHDLRLREVLRLASRGPH